MNEIDLHNKQTVRTERGQVRVVTATFRAPDPAGPGIITIKRTWTLPITANAMAELQRLRRQWIATH